jgi:hypothetical protein
LRPQTPEIRSGVASIPMVVGTEGARAVNARALTRRRRRRRPIGRGKSSGTPAAARWSSMGGTARFGTRTRFRPAHDPFPAREKKRSDRDLATRMHVPWRASRPWASPLLDAVEEGGGCAQDVDRDRPCDGGRRARRGWRLLHGGLACGTGGEREQPRGRLGVLGCLSGDGSFGSLFDLRERLRADHNEKQVTTPGGTAASTDSSAE